MKNTNNLSEEPIEEISSSLPLQILLYFNIFYDIIVVIELWASFVFKLRDYTQVMNFITIGIFVFAFSVWIVFECARIILGYVSNLQENVPRLFFVLEHFPADY